jgi:hypothetical protein
MRRVARLLGVGLGMSLTTPWAILEGAGGHIMADYHDGEQYYCQNR